MDTADYLRFALALIFVLGLIGVLASVARKAGFGFPAKAINPDGKRRLSIVEITALDSRRRLALIRRDDVEHLLLLTPTSEVVIETGIAPGEHRPGRAAVSPGDGDPMGQSENGA
ncbi:MAG: flagellar biosynthetic protein FliO [Magnetovibrio sp.]|nr:flagellar biosynthetic protein FliO [Magnetovibrio sp.]